MLYLKRFLWLAAWSVWLWLGFGLYRELPRDLGPVVCKVPFANLSTSFIGDGHEIYTHVSRGKGKPSAIRILDGDTGAEIRTFDNGPISETVDHDSMIDGLVLPLIDGSEDCFVSNRHALLVALKRPQLTNRPAHSGLSVLDLLTGKWIDLPEEVVAEPHFHDEKPWAAFSARESEFVVDLRTGAILFRRGNDRRDDVLGMMPDAFFLGSSGPSIVD